MTNSEKLILEILKKIQELPKKWRDGAERCYHVTQTGYDELQNCAEELEEIIYGKKRE